MKLWSDLRTAAVSLWLLEENESLVKKNPYVSNKWVPINKVAPQPSSEASVVNVAWETRGAKLYGELSDTFLCHQSSSDVVALENVVNPDHPDSFTHLVSAECNARK